jgi:ABC-type nitrate/sulfonate/bicarbonate transport system permease component
VILLVLVGVALLFAGSGLSVLYLDGSAVRREDLQGLLPTWEGLRLAWEQHHEVLLDVHLRATLWATLTGLCIAIGLGLFLAAVMDLAPLLRWLLYPVLILSQTIPTFAIAVILILIFGFGFGPKIVVVILFCFYPIAISTLNGLQSVNPVHTKLLKTLGANPLQLWWKVRLPTAMPSFFSGLRLAATYSVVGAVIGEYVGAGDGLGKFLQRSARAFQTDQVFLTVIIIAILSVGLVLFISMVEVLALRWRYVGQNSLWQALEKRLQILLSGNGQK